MSKVKITRVSTMPNQYGSFCYTVGSDKKDLPKEIEPLKTNPSGNMLIFSPVRIGDLNKEFVAETVVREKDGKKYLNLVDPKADLASEFGAIANNATKAGFANNTVLMKMFAEAMLAKPVLETV